jgi:hypothetical protein
LELDVWLSGTSMVNPFNDCNVLLSTTATVIPGNPMTYP